MTPPLTGTTARTAATPHIEHLRIRRSHLQTPVLHYKHRQSGRRISVFGMSHMGTAAYYADVLAQVEKIEASGGVVLAEGSQLYALSFDDATPQERAAMEEIKTQDSLLPRQAALLGWSTQDEHMPNIDGWRHADMNMLEILRFVGTEQYMTDVRAATAATKELLKRPMTLRLSARLSRSAACRTGPRRSQNALFEEKNLRTMAAVDATDADTAIIFGSAHLPTIDAGLVDRGFCLQATDWLSVGRLPSMRYVAAVFLLSLPMLPWRIACRMWHPGGRP